jgi:hypothetical protein
MGQRVLWQMDHHRGGHGALNCPLLMRLRGPLDVAALQRSVEELARRHEALRTTFTGRGPRLRQVIDRDPPPLPIREVALPPAPGALDAAIGEEVQARTDPAQRPVRVTLWRETGERSVLCVNMHHLITDGWSTAVIANELGELYDRLVTGAPGPGPVGWQYAQWAAWHRQQLTGEHLRRLQAYWRSQLQGARLPSLPRRASDVDLLQRRTAVARAAIPETTVAALRDGARARGTAPFAALLAVYFGLLARETGEDDLSVGSIFANRARREAGRTLGFLSNMVVLRSRAAAEAEPEVVLRACDEAVIGAFAHQELPFQMLPLDTIDAASVRPDAVVFQLFTGPMRPSVHAGVAFEPVLDVPDGIGSRWEFELSLLPDRGGFAVLLCYAEDLYERAFAERFVGGYVELAASWAAQLGATADEARAGSAAPRAGRPSGSSSSASDRSGALQAAASSLP